MIIFYISESSNQKAFISGNEVKHLTKVLRKKIGDTITCTDGKGTRYTCQIQSLTRDQVQLAIIERELVQKTVSGPEIAIAPPKNKSRFEWFLEKCVEIGADRIIPLYTKRSEHYRINVARSQNIIRSASLQSLRFSFPELSREMSFRDVINNYGQSNIQKWIAHYAPDNAQLSEVTDIKLGSVILIGPEGDFTEEELEYAKDNGFTEVNLSAHRLRTETAGIVAVTKLVN